MRLRIILYAWFVQWRSRIPVCLENGFRWMTFRKPLVYLTRGPNTPLHAFQMFCDMTAKHNAGWRVLWSPEPNELFPENSVWIRTTTGKMLGFTPREALTSRNKYLGPT